MNTALESALGSVDELSDEIHQSVLEIKNQEGYIKTMLNNATKSVTEPTQTPRLVRNNPAPVQDTKVLSVGPFKGINKQEAINKVMEKNEGLPAAIRQRESEEARVKQQQYTRRLAELEAEHEVRVESISSLYDTKIENNQATIQTLLEQIKALDARVGELTTMNTRFIEDRNTHIQHERDTVSEQRRTLNQVLDTLKDTIERLAIPIN